MDVNIIGNSAATNVQSGSGVTTPVANLPVTTPAAEPAPAPAPAPAVSASTATPPTTEQVKKAVDDINASLAANGNGQNVAFAVDPSSKRVVIQVIDQQTNKVIRQIPSEEIIQMSLSLGTKLGQVINQQA
jgi:flagellar protein FlaG